jgi:hypothetical protein
MHCFLRSGRLHYGPGSLWQHRQRQRGPAEKAQRWRCARARGALISARRILDRDSERRITSMRPQCTGRSERTAMQCGGREWCDADRHDGRFGERPNRARRRRFRSRANGFIVTHQANQADDGKLSSKERQSREKNVHHGVTSHCSGAAKMLRLSDRERSRLFVGRGR